MVKDHAPGDCCLDGGSSNGAYLAMKLSDSWYNYRTIDASVPGNIFKEENHQTLIRIGWGTNTNNNLHTFVCHEVGGLGVQLRAPGWYHLEVDGHGLI